jgi:hypothetical protein
MICENCSRAVQHAISQYNNVELEKILSASAEQNMPQEVEPYWDNRFDLLKKATNACWVCSRLRRWLESTNISPPLQQGNYFLPITWVCHGILRDVTNSDFALAYIDVGMSISEEEDTCEIEVNIIRSYGMEQNILPIYH